MSTVGRDRESNWLVSISGAPCEHASGLGGLRASILNGMCTWEIGGFSRCRRKPTSPCLFSSERPVFDSSRRETASAVDAMVRKIQFHFFRKNLQLFIKSQSFTATLQSLPTAQQLHFALQTTPLTPEMSQEPTAVAGGGDLLHFDFRGPRRPPPRTCTSRTLVRTLSHGPAQDVTP